MKEQFNRLFDKLEFRIVMTTLWLTAVVCFLAVMLAQLVNERTDFLQTRIDQLGDCTIDVIEEGKQ